MINEKEIIKLIQKYSIEQIATTVIVDENSIHKDIGLAKGDIIAFSGASAPQRLGIGSNNQFLIADSNEVTGMRWSNLTSNLINDLSEAVDDRVATLLINGNVTTKVYDDVANTLKIDVNYNATNLKITSNALNTIQDIATTSTPTFSQLSLTNQATTTSQAVRADRTISTNAPLTGGGNLTANRALSLSYNTTNLKLTSNALNTIQDIATTSSPTFKNLTLTESLKAKSITRAYISQNNWDNNTFGSQCGIGLNLNRLLNAAGGRYTVTATNITGNLNYMFDGTYERAVIIPAGQTGIIEIDFNPQVGWTANTSSGYTYMPGLFVLTTYNVPVANIKLEVYRKNTGTGLDEWSDVFHKTDNNQNPFIYYIPHIYLYIKKLRLTIVNPSSVNNLYITEIEWFPVREDSDDIRNSFSALPRLFTVFPMDVQFNPLRFRDNTWQKVIDIEKAGNILFFNGTKKIGSGDNNALQIVQNNTSVLHIDTAKNVGISTTTPAYKLDVAGTGRFTQDLSLDTILNQKGTSGVNIFKADINQQGNKSIYNNFTSGWTGSGWRIDYGITNPSRTHLELDDLTVRGVMRVIEFIIYQTRATNGGLFVSSSAKAETVTRVNNIPVTYTIVFEDPEGNNLCPFAVNDIVFVKRVKLDSTTIVKLIVLQVTAVTGKQITGTVIYEYGQITKGDLVVRIGNTTDTARQGSVYLTSDDSNAPYIDIVDGVDSWAAWGSSDKLKVRLGRLSGITDSFFGTLSGYGLYAKTNAYLRGKIYAEEGGWIAGWTINSTDLSSPLIASNHQLKLIANDSSSVIGAYLDVNIGGGNPLYLSFGRIKIGNNIYSSYYGLSAKDESGNDYFELSNGRKHIANWDFDNNKFYKGTDIELNSTSKSIGVNSNKVKMFYTDANTWGIQGLDVNSNTVFKLGSENEIAGWKFDNNYLWKLGGGSPSSSPSKGLVLDSTNRNIGVYGSTWHRAVYVFYTDDDNWGIKGYKNDTSLTLVFELGSNNQIAGWSFDESKLSKNNTRLESSSTFKGLAVSKSIGSNNVDAVKIGEYSLGSPSTYLSQFTFAPNYTTYGWNKTYTINTDGATPSDNNHVFTTTTGNIATFSFLKTNDNSLKNKYIRLKTTITMPSPQAGGWRPKCDITITLNGVTIYSKTYSSGEYPNVGGWTDYFDKTFLYLGGVIQISVYLVNDTGGGAYFVPVTIAIDNRDVLENDAITEISNEGFRIYDSGGIRGLFYNTTDGLKIKGSLNLSDDWTIVPNSVDETIDWYYRGVKVAQINYAGVWSSV